MIDPQIGETIYDPACGSGGFLVEAFEHLRAQEQVTKDYRELQEGTLFGNEKKALPALLGTMNLVLHGVMLPQIRRRNTLEENIRDVSERFAIVLTNPPFGGTENTQIQQNFPVKSNATELLFLEHVVKKLKPRDGARCGMVVPEGTLFRGGAFTSVREELLTALNLYMVVSLPPGTFAPYSDVKTALLFFERPGPTKEVLYYEMPLPQNLKKFSKGSLISDEHFAEARATWERWKFYRQGRAFRPEPTMESWIESIEILAERGYDLSAKNPHAPKGTAFPSFAELTAVLLERDHKFRGILERLHDAANSSEEVK